jgi:hypothetical protein
MQYVHGKIQMIPQVLNKLTKVSARTSLFPYHFGNHFSIFLFSWISGLSPKTGLPFSPPMAFRSTPRKTVGAREKAALEEGLCHACQRWIVIEGVKAVEVLVPEIYWYVFAGGLSANRAA